MNKSAAEKLEPPPTGEDTAPVEVPEDLRLLGALVRTAFSSEQTLMSWMRTAVSLFTFGFSISQFFHYLDKQQGGAILSAGPRRLGLALICLGVLALALAMFEHLHRLRALQRLGMPKISQYLLPLGSAAIFLVIGIIALVSVFFSWSL